MQFITPCLWFNDESEEAARLYVEAFKNGKIKQTSHYLVETPSDKPVGSVLGVEFELFGFEFITVNGGDIFKANPALSFMVSLDSKEEIDEAWAKLTSGGKILMPLQEYPFSRYYGWVEDKFGVSWQIILPDADGDPRPKVVPAMLFTQDNCGRAAEAAEFYLSIFPDSKLGQSVPYGKEQESENPEHIMFSDFSLNGVWIVAMDSGLDHKFVFTEGVSLQVLCADQKEVDYYWEKLGEGGNYGPCGWLKDKFGVSWQIVPQRLIDLLSDETKPEAKAAMAAMLKMGKIEVGELEKAINF